MTAIKNFMQRETPDTLEKFCYQYFGVDESLLTFMNEDLKKFDDNQILAIKDGQLVFAHDSEVANYINKKFSDIAMHISSITKSEILSK